MIEYSDGGTMKTKDKYSGIAKSYDKMEEVMMFNNYRREVLEKSQGNILEVKNRTGIDFSPGMIKVAKEKAESIGVIWNFRRCSSLKTPLVLYFLPVYFVLCLILIVGLREVL